MPPNLDPLEDLGDLFVDRQEELDLFWEWVRRIPHVPNNSYALIGQRRTGKTSILKRLFNQLYYQQDKVMPVYISFSRYLHLRRPLTMEEVANRFLSSYIGCYLAFRYRQPHILRQKLDMDRIRLLASPFDDPIVNDLLQGYEITSNSRMSQTVAQYAIHRPEAVAGIHNLPTAVIIDEFQVLTDVEDPKQGVAHDLTDSFQEPSETRWAPLLVAGSAVLLMVDQALTGLLQGRFGAWYVKPLGREHTHDLTFRLGERYGCRVTEELAEAVWQLTEGYPYSIYSLLASNCPARHKGYPSLATLQEVLTFELTDRCGYLWKHYRGEFLKYSHRFNGDKITQRILFWVTKFPNQQIDSEQIADALGVEEDVVLEVLAQLYEADIIEDIGWSAWEAFHALAKRCGYLGIPAKG